MDSIKNIIKIPELKKPPAYKWQDLALDIIKGIPDANTKKSSVFKCCKQSPQHAKIAFEDCKELNKLYVQYFLKVFNELESRTNT
ncbi:MAG: hypothetical protein A2469_02465 [Candidatus Magasanikbacteria bacterium RIFOXYC2_FULL_40_16]|uniref:Uncharacterized protein n=3 Tax=Candidatus Magasanikiibacteriota TaxID=1752731 RepID=A0A1F6NG48_9BACT|nr:MAG: hypothetical protein A2224_00865 [Candidatus Magasanikbacteria bacterium RIFOXYA2_FULL_40_20]OGH82809.1 MAG: hypothetical protein A2373_01060 [Candidatus Magasanikbacteria bacterium RIFOXYB1_FULL_40_15]OGH86994.1 MAG: hypothetical protein A2301_01665 [Candidatus Magasanikbacteria bacterium RIFOXYB2_FULL_40_13]OGH87912.1 MAG: hypothetical protein A2206_03625 [Candidatus Magasanikbacteria bacterium RIFOXYA1_FULL_40_8]OGH89404.1 MAG: hypothetical protein A2469_02465 [Candidatus Magasanikba